MHTDPHPTPPAIQGIQTQIGAGTFLVRRQYVGSRPVGELLQQRVQQAAHTTSSIDEGIGAAV
ncbi:hypothetical protein [uncultured Agathobaculum sp.]|uniref:hypothetical protein n=1 Tax=uncultured Agathobaculum sp. TaxID=2048140 RepID=UPI003209845F